MIATGQRRASRQGRAMPDQCVIEGLLSMLTLQPMREPEKPTSEPMVSFLCGVPSLAIGVGGLIILLSYAIGFPIGSRVFSNADVVNVV
jgi:hypothetical protein